ncbi:MAG: hypothetical protein HYR73_06445 [Candidatus Eisenbacteria bacterium]|nr:hypothetical protein [Candidatus Eisenbacteria bacterium]
MRRAATIAVIGLACVAPRFAVADLPAPAAATDTTLDRFFGGLSDSTDRYFGGTTSQVDTTGLDSSRAANLALPPGHGPRRPLRLDWGPAFRFNRVDGPAYGATLGLRSARTRVRIDSRLEYAAGPNRWQGGAGFRRMWGDEEHRWTLEAWGGRETAVVDRTHESSAADPLATVRALGFGTDARLYLRHDGFRAGLSRASGAWRAAAEWRDELESPLDVTATWNLANRALDVPGNIPAQSGRTHEALFSFVGRAPRLPLQGEIEYRTSRRALGSDFEYRMTRAALGADITLGRWSALVPQAIYGRLTGDALPQESFYLGGVSALTTRIGEAVGGSRLALGRIDWIGTRDLLALAHIPHPALLPIQGAVFAASGAVWGTDPYGGASRAGGAWPEEAWISEAGLSLIWQPGFPDPTSLGRINVAWPVGSATGSPRVTLTFSRALFLLAPLGN